MTVRSKIIEIVREMPGLTAVEIGELMPELQRGQVSGSLSTLAAEGILLRESKPRLDYAGHGRRTIYTHTINPDPKPLPRVARKAESPSGSALAVRVAELEAWKADALARYPDLAVDPIVLDARRIVAGQLNGTDPALSKDILAGRKDAILPMRVAVEALSRVSVQ